MPELHSEIFTIAGEPDFAGVPGAGGIICPRTIPFAELGRLWFFRLYLLFIAGYTIRIAALQARGADGWMTGSWTVGDWLINYSGGFVRRGLPGAVAMILHRATALPLVWVVFLIQVVVFLLFLGCVYELTKGIHWGYWLTAVLLSPATLSFTVLDSQGAGLRKELLLFAGLAAMILVLGRERLKDSQLSTLLSIFLVVLALSHEGLLVAAPYCFAAVAVQTCSLRRAIRILAVPFLVTGIVSIAVILHHGNFAVAQAICTSVGNTTGIVEPSQASGMGNICSGSISWLQLTVSEERALIVGHERDAWRLYSLLVLPTFVPLVALLFVLYRRDRLRFEVITLAVCALVSVTATGVLCYMGMDWGRWFHLQAICLMLLAIMIDRKADRSVDAAEPARPHGKFHQAVAGLALLIYVTVWTLPGVGLAGWSPGYVSLAWPNYRATLHQARLEVVGKIGAMGL
jgi:hypothetical protein